MADIPDYDPTTDDEGAAEGGAAGGGDDDAHDLFPPGEQTESTEEQRRKWNKKGARPKTKGPYTEIPGHDGGTNMPTFPTERNGLPSTPKNTEETSFIEGTPSGRIITAAEQLGTIEVEQHFPTMDHSKVEVRYISQERGGLGDRFKFKMRNKTKWYPLFTQKGMQMANTF